MKATKGKRLTYLTIALGVLVLAIAGYASRDLALEQWFIWQLGSDDKAIQVAAAEKLAYFGSVRAVPHLIQAIETMESENSWDAVGGGPPPVRTGIMLTPMAYALYRIGPDALPAVRRAYEKEITAGRGSERFCLVLLQIQDSVTTTSLYVRKSYIHWGPPRNYSSE